jgi:hypothetical protein
MTTMSPGCNVGTNCCRRDRWQRRRSSRPSTGLAGEALGMAAIGGMDGTLGTRHKFSSQQQYGGRASTTCSCRGNRAEPHLPGHCTGAWISTASSSLLMAKLPKEAFESRHNKPSALWRDAYASDRAAGEFEEVRLDAVRENHTIRRHERFDYQFLALLQKTGHQIAA